MATPEKQEFTGEWTSGKMQVPSRAHMHARTPHPGIKAVPLLLCARVLGFGCVHLVCGCCLMDAGQSLCMPDSSRATH